MVVYVKLLDNPCPIGDNESSPWPWIVWLWRGVKDIAGQACWRDHQEGYRMIPQSRAERNVTFTVSIINGSRDDSNLVLAFQDQILLTYIQTQPRFTRLVTDGKHIQFLSLEIKTRGADMTYTLFISILANNSPILVLAAISENADRIRAIYFKASTSLYYKTLNPSYSRNLRWCSKSSQSLLTYMWNHCLMLYVTSLFQINMNMKVSPAALGTTRKPKVNCPTNCNSTGYLRGLLLIHVLVVYGIIIHRVDIFNSLHISEALICVTMSLG